MSRFPEEYIFDPRDIPRKKGWDMREIIKELERNVVRRDFLEFFERDPDRSAPQGAGIIVAPADGILEVGGDSDRHVLIIHIRLTDVHVQRVPLGGVVRSVERTGSGYLYPDQPGHFGNVRVVTALDTPAGACEVEQIATLTTRRIRNSLKPGDRVETGQRMGNILLGSTAVLRMPRRGVRLEAAPGSRVYGGETLLARFSPP